MKLRIAISAASLIVGILTAAPAKAEEERGASKLPQPEGYLSIFVGTTVSDEEGFYLDRPAASESSFRLTDYSGEVISLRFGRWQKRRPWFGAATDFTYHDTNSANGEIGMTVMTISPMFFFRVPIMRSEETPEGLFSVYAGIGPTLNRVRIQADIKPELSRTVEDIEITVGYKWALGARWEVFDGIALVGEYRFSADSFSISEFEESACYFCPDALAGEARLDTHHFLIGVSFLM